MNEKDGAIRDASVLGVPKMLILGLQHMFAMFGATILVPILVNSYFGEDVLHVQVTLICAGIGTLFFHLCSKFKVPAFLGSSFAFLGGFATIANMDSGVFADMSNADKLSYACGGIVVAGLLYLILALIIKLVGVKKVMRFLPPVVTGPIIICIGLSLAGSAINNASTNWLLALIALVTIIVFNIWGRGMFKIIPILMGVIISYIAALIFNAMGMTNADGSALLSFTDIANASWVGVPAFSLCKFNLSAILVMAPIALATMMEHIGDISAISATVDQNFIEDPGLHRTLIGDGLATSLSALVGGPANTTYGENTGVLETEQSVRSKSHPHRSLLRHHLKLYSEDGCCDRFHAVRYHRRCQLHALRYDLRHRRPQCCGKSCGFYAVTQSDHRRRDLRVRSWFLRRSYLYDRRNLRHTHRAGSRSDRRYFLKCHPAGQRLSLRKRHHR